MRIHRCSAVVLLLFVSTADSKPVPPSPRPRGQRGEDGFAFLESDKPDREREGLKGPVRSVVTRWRGFSRPFLGILGKRRPGPWLTREEVTYGRSGYAIEKRLYDAKGVLYVEESSVYNEQGRAVLAENVEYSGSRIVRRESWKSTYDDSGRLVETRFYDGEGSLVSVDVNTYNAKGNLVETKRSSADGSLLCKAVWKYDTNGKLRDHVCYQGNGTTDVVYRFAYTYDQEGRKTQEVRYQQGDRVNWKKEYAYDGRGNIVEYTEHGETGQPRSKVLHRYDAGGNKIGTVSYAYGRSGSLENRTVYTCDAKGMFEEFVLYKRDGCVASREVYRYDENGNMTEWLWYGGGKVLEHRELHTYDKDGSKVKEVRLHYDGKGRLLWKDENTYDKKGGMTLAGYRGDGSLESKLVSTGELDQYGNWIKWTHSELVGKGGDSHLRPSEMTERIITYYEDVKEDEGAD